MYDCKWYVCLVHWWNQTSSMFTACPFQSCLRVQSGLLLDLPRPPLASSTLGHQFLAHGLLPVATQLACLEGSLECPSMPWGGCSQGPKPGPGWILLFSPAGAGSWWCLQECLYLEVHAKISAQCFWKVPTMENHEPTNCFSFFLYWWYHSYFWCRIWKGRVAQ